jgi:hypothetical protein
MIKLHPECPHTNTLDHSVVADFLLRQEPDEEDEGNRKEDNDDEDDSDDGYSECPVTRDR